MDLPLLLSSQESQGSDHSLTPLLQWEPAVVMMLVKNGGLQQYLLVCKFYCTCAHNYYYLTPNHMILYTCIHCINMCGTAKQYHLEFIGKTLGTRLFKVLYRVEEVIILSFLGNLCKSSRNLKQVSLLVRDHINGICTFSKWVKCIDIHMLFLLQLSLLTQFKI